MSGIRSSIESLIPGMYPNAARRNVLVLLCYLLVFGVLTGPVIQ